MKIEMREDMVQLEAENLAPLLGELAEDVPKLMREGRIASVVERGEGKDAGRFRGTLRHGATRLRFMADGEGNVLSRSRLSAAGG